MSSSPHATPTASASSLPVPVIGPSSHPLPKILPGSGVPLHPVDAADGLDAGQFDGAFAARGADFADGLVAAQTEARDEVTGLALTLDAGEGAQFRIGGDGARLPAARDARQGMGVENGANRADLACTVNADARQGGRNGNADAANGASTGDPAQGTVSDGLTVPIRRPSRPR